VYVCARAFAFVSAFVSARVCLCLCLCAVYHRVAVGSGVCRSDPIDPIVHPFHYNGRWR
jgi:hypothetical protein